MQVLTPDQIDEHISTHPAFEQFFRFMALKVVERIDRELAQQKEHVYSLDKPKQKGA